MGPTTLTLESRDPDEALPQLGELFSSEARLSRRPDDFSVRARGLAGDRLAALRIRMAGRFEIDTDVGVIMIMRVNGGTLEAPWVPKRSPRAGELFLIPPGVGRRSAADSPDLQLLGLDPAVLETIARELTGDERLRVRFSDATPISSGLERHWASAARFVVTHVLENPAVWNNQLIRDEALRTLAVATLQLFPNTTLEQPNAADRVAPTAVRRAIQFIDDNLDSPITIGDVAVAARLSVRGLQAAFQRQLDQTPSAYLRRARLAAAHRELEAAQPGATVQDIAHHWGFGHSGRFATEYRATFGELPSATLAH